MKKIALLGYGTVGSGVYELVEKNRDRIFKKYNKGMALDKILVRSLKRYETLEHYELFTNDFEDIIAYEPDVVIEVMGGIEPAHTYIRHFLENGVDVITANKDLIAEYGGELLALARENGALLKYEASVGGGIPILKAIQESLRGNHFDGVQAVINGTTNFILTKMHNEDMPYKDALKIAQDMGFAESDPTSDVCGFDAGRKLAIMSSLAYEKNIKWSILPIEGITEIEPIDIENAKLLASKVKLVAMSRYEDNRFYGAVRPVFVNASSPLGLLDNEFNGVQLTGDAVGAIHFLGKGAGKLPTASAVYGDLIDVIQDIKLRPDVQFDNDFTSTKTLPCKAKWAIRVSGTNLMEMTQCLTYVFIDNKLRIEKGHSSSDILAIIEETNEEQLITKLNMLFSNPYVEKIKHFLILDSL
ncbi:MAG: homoserine dehydrogenase [Clostridia bacterium]|nr:homoserine dehydrogenase [Clostridia bacterium]